MPRHYQDIMSETQRLGFAMASDVYVGSLLRTLVASKPAGSFLELGTGLGLTLSWMLHGMDRHAKIVSIDNDPEVSVIADKYLGEDPRAEIICTDGRLWIQDNEQRIFALIFADTRT